MLSSRGQYIELSIRSRIRRAFMLTKANYDALIAAENMQTLLRRLEETHYRTLITSTGTEQFNLVNIVESLAKIFKTEHYFVLSRIKDKNALEFYREFNRRYELECIASILKSVLMGVEWSKASQYIVPYGKLDSDICKNLVDGKNVKNALLHIKEKNLAINIDGILKKTEDTAKLTLELDTTIQKYSFETIWSKIKKVKGLDTYAIRLMGIYIDTLNIINILRMKKMGLKSEEIHKYLINAYYKLSEEDVKKAVSSTTEKDAMRSFTGGWYVKVISPLISIYETKNDLSLVETALKRYHSRECSNMFTQQIFHLGEAIAYVHLRWYEMRDLITIITGKHFGISRDKIENASILHQPIYPLM